MESKLNNMNSNKLISEFMGMEDHQEMGEYVTPNYNTSWDSLMTVIEKCFDNSEDGDMQYIMHHLMVVDFNNTYKEVIQFINQYNNK